MVVIVVEVGVVVGMVRAVLFEKEVGKMKTDKDPAGLMQMEEVVEERNGHRAHQAGLAKMRAEIWVWVGMWVEMWAEM